MPTRSHLPPPLPIDGRGAVVTVGTFDGIHLGHQAVLEEISRRGERTGRRSVLVTFHPHPLRIVRPEIAPQLRELLVIQLAHVHVAHEHGTRRQRVESGQAMHQRRLARARRTHDRREATGAELDGHAVERPDFGLAAAVYL